jgi:hypothetical protein
MARGNVPFSAGRVLFLMSVSYAKYHDRGLGAINGRGIVSWK